MPKPKILAAVVHSDTGRHAGKEAVHLSLSMHADLIIVSVIPAYYGNMSLLHIEDPQKALSGPHEKVIAEIQEEAKRAGVPAKTRLEQGEPYERIVDAADVEKADMVVIGSGRRSLIERSILGSTAARVIGYCSCDVLVIPPETSIDFRNMLLAVDGSPCSRNAARRAIALAKDYGGKLTVINVLDVPSEYYLHETAMSEMLKKSKAELEIIANWAAEKNVTPDTLVLQGETYEMIVQTARERLSDLIVIGSYGRTGIRRLLMGSVVERVLTHAPCPVLVVH